MFEQKFSNIQDPFKDITGAGFESRSIKSTTHREVRVCMRVRIYRCVQVTQKTFTRTYITKDEDGNIVGERVVDDVTEGGIGDRRASDIAYFM